MDQHQANGFDLDLPDGVRVSGPVLHRQDMPDPQVPGPHLQRKSHPEPLSNVSRFPQAHENGAQGMQLHADSCKQNTPKHTKDSSAPPTSWTLAKSSPLFRQQPQREAADPEQAPANKGDSCTYLTDHDAVACGHAPAQPPDMARLMDPASTPLPAGNGLDRGRLLWKQALQSAQPSSQSHAPKGLLTKSVRSEPTEVPGDMEVAKDANPMSIPASMSIPKTAGKEAPEKIAHAKQTFLAQIAKLNKENAQLEKENAWLREDNARLLKHNKESADADKLRNSWEDEVPGLVEAAKQFA